MNTVTCEVGPGIPLFIDEESDPLRSGIPVSQGIWVAEPRASTSPSPACRACLPGVDGLWTETPAATIFMRLTAHLSVGVNGTRPLFYFLLFSESLDSREKSENMYK